MAIAVCPPCFNVLLFFSLFVVRFAQNPHPARHAVVLDRARAPGGLRHLLLECRDRRRFPSLPSGVGALSAHISRWVSCPKESVEGVWHDRVGFGHLYACGPVELCGLRQGPFDEPHA